MYGVDADFVRHMSEAGLGELSADDLIGMRMHGVDLAYLRAMQELDVVS